MSPENLNILNLAIAERNRTRKRLGSQQYPAGREELICLGPDKLLLPNHGYREGATTGVGGRSSAATSSGSVGSMNMATNATSSSIHSSVHPVSAPPNAHIPTANMFNATSSSIPASTHPASSSSNTHMPTNNTNNNSSVASLIQMFQNLSPTSIQHVVSALTSQTTFVTPPTVISSISSNTFENNLKQPASVNYTECYNQVPPQIDIVRARGLYIPLTCFLNKSWRRMHTAGDSLTYSKHPDQLGGKSITILNVNQFGVEDSLSLGQWTEAWKNYGTFLNNLMSKHALSHWLEHYRWIIGQSNFDKDFILYHAFDIKERQSYIHDPCAFDSEAYHHRFQSVRLDIISSLIASLITPPSGGMGHGVFRSSSASGACNGFKPYDCPAQRADFSRPFPSGTSSPTGLLSCLVCSRAGHCYNVCKFGKFADNTALFAKSSGSGLVSRQHNIPLCISYNVGGKRVCKGHPPSSNLEHRCSFCGDSNHFALSFSCRLAPTSSLA